MLLLNNFVTLSRGAQYALTAVLMAFAISHATATVASAQSSTLRIAVIDSRAILQAMPGRARAESDFALELAGARELVHTATDSLKAAVEELSRHETDLRPQQREAAMMILRARELTLEDMVAQLNLLAGKRLVELQAPFLERMRQAVRAVRARDRFAIVIDIAHSDAVVDVDNASSINDRVIAELQRTASARP